LGLACLGGDDDDEVEVVGVVSLGLGALRFFEGEVGTTLGSCLTVMVGLGMMGCFDKDRGCLAE
jgi:hypothetical protein